MSHPLADRRADYCDYCTDPRVTNDCFACQGTGQMLLCTACGEDTQRIFGTTLCRECAIDMRHDDNYDEHTRDER